MHGGDSVVVSVASRIRGPRAGVTRDSDLLRLWLGLGALSRPSNAVCTVAGLHATT